MFEPIFAFSAPMTSTSYYVVDGGLGGIKPDQLRKGLYIDVSISNIKNVVIYLLTIRFDCIYNGVILAMSSVQTSNTFFLFFWFWSL